MTKIRKYITVALLTATALGASAKEVVRIMYNDGLSDYIPVETIKSIGFTNGIDTETEGFIELTNALDDMKSFMSIYTNHFDFGYPAIMIGLDSQTEDYVCADSGWNHFSYWYNFYTYQKNNTPGTYMWGKMYSLINYVNHVLEKTDKTPQGHLIEAQAHALRSFAYWNLIQTFSVNYAIDPSAQGVIILGDECQNATKDFEPRELSTVKEVYEYIINEINTAINNLEDSKLHPALMDVENSKRYIDLATAYGLRARYHLTMHRYAEAASDAKKAIDISSAKPSLAEVAGYPGYNNAKAGNWMWAITVSPEDRISTSGIVNFVSHVSTFSKTGYTAVGVFKSASKYIWDYLSSQPGDVRSNLFVKSDLGSSTLTESQRKYLANSIFSGIYYSLGVNVKFDTYRSDLLNQQNIGDIPLMRIEEMYYILAEGLAMSGDIDTAKKVLIDFVTEYRNPEYACAATTATELQEEILWQRRLELWGEGLIFFDYLRLQRDINRADAGFRDSYALMIRGTSPFMLYQYPNYYPLIKDYDSVVKPRPDAVPAPYEWAE